MLYDEFIKNVNEENVEAILNSISLGILVRRFDGEFVFGRVKNFIQVPHDVMKKLIIILLKTGLIHYARRCSSQIIYLNESDLARFDEVIRYDYLLGKEGSTFDIMNFNSQTRVDFFVDTIVEYELDESNKILHEGLFRIYKKNRLISKEKIIGGYCVIKNKRGEFLTLLSTTEIEQAKKVAKTTSIWDAWYAEMALKTVIKKAVKFHFDDIYTEMEEEDNKNYDLDLIEDKPVLPEGLVNAIMEAENVDKLKDIYKREYNNLDCASLKADFVQFCTNRKQELANASL
jgi:hypothetical protein